MATRYVVTGIGTDVGKTVVSAVLAEALKANYWKPIQAGDLERSDSITISSLTSDVKIIPEAFRLSQPMSPHAAAKIDGIVINEKDLSIPDVQGNLIIEGAGGLNVPVNEQGLLYADVFQGWNLPVIIVSRHYLGNINHTLMTIEVLKARNIPIKGIIFVGEENSDTEKIIASVGKVEMIGRIPVTESLDADFIQVQANKFRGII